MTTMTIECLCIKMTISHTCGGLMLMMQGPDDDDDAPGIIAGFGPEFSEVLSFPTSTHVLYENYSTLMPARTNLQNIPENYQPNYFCNLFIQHSTIVTRSCVKRKNLYSKVTAFHITKAIAKI